MEEQTLYTETYTRFSDCVFRPNWVAAITIAGKESGTITGSLILNKKKTDLKPFDLKITCETECGPGFKRTVYGINVVSDNTIIKPGQTYKYVAKEIG